MSDEPRDEYAFDYQQAKPNRFSPRESVPKCWLIIRLICTNQSVTKSKKVRGFLRSLQFVKVEYTAHSQTVLPGPFLLGKELYGNGFVTEFMVRCSHQTAAVIEEHFVKHSIYTKVVVPRAVSIATGQTKKPGSHSQDKHK